MSRPAWRANIALMSIAALLTACTWRGLLRPAPSQEGIPHEAGSAVATAAGIRLVVRTGGWNGNPPGLEQAVIALNVAIENHGTHPLRVRYPELKLRGPALDYQPLPPALLVGNEVTVRSKPLLVPRGSFDGFHIAPYRCCAALGNTPWTLPWENDPGFYKRQYAKWTVSLPTVDMIERALPEGVLDPGGRISGFLYFQHLHREAQTAHLTFDLIDARSALSFGTLSIDFVGH